MNRIALIVSAAVLALATPAPAADERAPDWPCHQIKVPSLSAAAMWAGPPLDDVAGKWQEDRRIADLVATLAARRTPLDQANKLIVSFVDDNKGAEQQRQAAMLFAGLFDTLNRERSTVMDAIQRFAGKRRAFADRIRSESAELRQQQAATDPDRSKIDDLTNRITWDMRIYGDQAKTINYVCEVPQIIERRLFELSRTIQQSLD